MNIFPNDPELPHIHCPVILEQPSHELMVVWYAALFEGDISQGIKASWKPIEGGDWTPPQMIFKTPKHPDGNTVIAWYQDAVQMFITAIPSIFMSYHRGFLCHTVSTDGGRTWAPTDRSDKVLPKLGYSVRTKPLVIGDRLIVPVGRERYIQGYAQMLITDDGIHYHLSQKIKPPKGFMIQPAITQLSDGNLLAYFRSDQGCIYSSTSTDLGETWSPVTALTLKNPYSGLDFVRTPNSEMILVWNNNLQDLHYKGVGMTAFSRRCINIGYSPDEGKTWPLIKELERDDETGNFAYPAIIIGSDNLFHCVYSSRRQTITYVKFDLEWLLDSSSN
jgi:hypothetical protein